MQITETLRKRFCRDAGIPITIFSDPYFGERLGCLGGIDKYDLFLTELQRFESETDYLQYRNETKEKIIAAIRDNPAFIHFSSDNGIARRKEFSSVALYSPQNDGKYFVSIDMKSANFSALSAYDPAIFDYAPDWESFAGRFTDMKHIQVSKYIRQVIMGTLNPKRQITFEGLMIDTLIDDLLSASIITRDDIYSVDSDEVILKAENGPEMERIVGDVSGFLREYEYGKIFRVDGFDLVALKYPDIADGIAGWVKRGRKISFKCVPAEISHMVVKKWFGYELSGNDMVFVHNGRLAKYLPVR